MSAAQGPDGAAGDVVLSAHGVTRRFGERTALDGVTLSLRAGELLALAGPNGAGKTTLLTILAGIAPADAGEVRRPAGDPGWVPQRPAAYGKLSVAENLRLFARLERLPDPEAAVTRMLEQTGLGERAGSRLADLSGGNQQRVNIALGLIAAPPVLLLDEPTASLDPAQRERLWGFVSALVAGGTAVLYSTHDIAEVERHADRVLVLEEGHVRFDGTPGHLIDAAPAPAGTLAEALLQLLGGSVS